MNLITYFALVGWLSLIFNSLIPSVWLRVLTGFCLGVILGISLEFRKIRIV